MVSEPKDIPTLNGFRGLAVLIVFGSHASNVYFHGAVTGFGGGQLGVMLFFMLSGFLMAHLYFSRDAAASAQVQFAINRIARIYPMFTFVVLACYLVKVLGIPLLVYQIVSFKDVLFNLTFIRGYEVLWTIGPEVIFYGIFLVLWKLQHINRVSFFIAVIAMTAFAWVPLTVAPTNSLFALHEKLPYFLVGCVLGMQSDSLIANELSTKAWVKTAFWCCAAIFFISMPQLVRLIADVPTRLTGDPWPDPWSFPFYLITTTGLFVTSIIAKPWLLTNRLMIYLGNISFSFYLLHLAILKNIQPLLPTYPVLGILLSGLIALGLSSICYACIERPARTVIRHFANRP